MKYSVLIFLLMLFMGCSHGNKETAGIHHSSGGDFGARLVESGFLEFADTLKLDSLKSALVSSFDIYNEHSNKIAPIDAEELAEFSFDPFMPGLNNVLEKRGFTLTVQAADDYENTNDVFINGEKIKLYTKEELENGTFWESASPNFFKEINKQLRSRKAVESFYLLYAGNDLNVMLLTADQHTIIAEKYKDEPGEIPYLP